MEKEKTAKPQNKAEDKEFVARLTEFIKTKRPTKTSDFVKAGLFKNRGEARKVLRELAKKKIVRMERNNKKRYRYALFGEPLVLPKDEKPKQKEKPKRVPKGKGLPKKQKADDVGDLLGTANMGLEPRREPVPHPLRLGEKVVNPWIGKQKKWL